MQINGHVSPKQFFIFQDHCKTSSRCVCRTSSKDILKMYSQDVFERHVQDFFKDISNTCFQDVFFKTSLRRLQEDALQTRLKDVLEDKKCYAQDVSKTSSKRLHQDERLLRLIICFLRNFEGKTLN